MKASTDTFKVIESIDDQAGSYYFSPALIASGSRRKQRPLPPPPPARLSRKGTRLSRGGGNPWVDGSSYLDRAGSDRCSKGWSRSSMRAPQHKPIDSTRIETGQSSLRGRVRCQSHFVAWERRRREPGSNSVIVTIALTRDEGHVAGRGGLQRVRKIFAGCPAIPSLRGQSPVHTSSRSVHRSRSVGNRPVYYYGQPNLCRPAAEAQIQDRSRTKTWLNTAQAFSRVSDNIPSPSKGQGQGERRRSPLPRWERARVRVKEARSAATAGDAPAHPVIPADSPPSFPPTPPSFPRRREPREKQSTPFANLVYPSMRIPPTRHHHPLPYNRNHYDPNFSPLNPTSHDNPNPNHQSRSPHPCHRRTFDGVSCVVRSVARRRVDQQRR